MAATIPPPQHQALTRKAGAARKAYFAAIRAWIADVGYPRAWQPPTDPELLRLEQEYEQTRRNWKDSRNRLILTPHRPRTT